MAVKKTIAIVGADDNLGTAIARRLVQHPYRLLLVSDNTAGLQEKWQHLAPGSDVEVAGCTKDSCWEADVIILTVPAAELKEVTQRIKEVATQKTVINFSLTAKNNSGNSTAVTGLQHLLPHAKIIQVLASADKNSCVIAGDDEEAMAEAASIIRQAGFQPSVANNFSQL